MRSTRDKYFSACSAVAYSLRSGSLSIGVQSGLTMKLSGALPDENQPTIHGQIARLEGVRSSDLVRPRPLHFVSFQGQFPVVRMSRVYAGFPGQLCTTMILAEPSGFFVRL